MTKPEGGELRGRGKQYGYGPLQHFLWRVAERKIDVSQIGAFAQKTCEVPDGGWARNPVSTRATRTGEPLAV